MSSIIFGHLSACLPYWLFDFGQGSSIVIVIMTSKRTVTDSDRLVARNIKRLRGSQGIGRRDLEEKAGIAFGILDQIETFHKPAGKSIQGRLAEALNCALSELYKEGGAKRLREAGSSYFTNRQKKLLDAAGQLTDDEFADVLKYIEWVRARRGGTKTA